MQREEGEEIYGHAGMLGAAAAVWEDLRNNHLLAALLGLPADENCKPALQHHDPDDREYDPRMSRSERDRHMEWEGSGAQDCDEGSAHGQARQAAHAAKDQHHSSRNKHRPFGEPLRLTRSCHCFCSKKEHMCVGEVVLLAGDSCCDTYRHKSRHSCCTSFQLETLTSIFGGLVCT